MTTVERAFEIARGGGVRTIRDIRLRLKSEGFEGVQDHLNGTLLQKQLRIVMNAHRR
jgi:hypothetical protein